MNTVDIINDCCYFLYSEVISTNPNPLNCPFIYVQTRSHDSANDNTAEFIRENKSPEGKSVEILVFVVYKNLLLLREAHRLGRTMLIRVLDRRKSKNSG